MITGLHSVIFTKDAEKDRVFFRDVLKFPNVDVGGGWLVFSTPPSEIAFHPAEVNDKHEIYFLCDDVETQIKELEASGCSCAPIKEEKWGRVTAFTLPGGGSVGLYQPLHAQP